MTSTDARGARSAGEPRSQGGPLTKRGRASLISGGWAPEGLKTHKITAETFPSQERASPRGGGETIPGWKEAKRFSAPRPRKGDDSWGPGLGTAPPLQVPEATESPWEGRGVRPPWAAQVTSQRAPGWLAVCSARAQGQPWASLTARPRPRHPPRPVGPAANRALWRTAPPSDLRRPPPRGQREGAAEPEAMAGDADCPVHGGEGQAAPRQAPYPARFVASFVQGSPRPTVRASRSQPTCPMPIGGAPNPTWRREPQNQVGCWVV